MQTTKPRFNLSKASFIASLIACGLLAICFKWLDEFKKFCPVEGCGIGHRIFGDTWHDMAIFSAFASPLFALSGLLLGIAARLKQQEQYKVKALTGVRISALVLIAYSVTWVILLSL